MLSQKVKYYKKECAFIIILSFSETKNNLANNVLEMAILYMYQPRMLGDSDMSHHSK